MMWDLVRGATQLKVPTPTELGRRYRAARGRVERGHLQVVWLLVQGRSRGEVARIGRFGDVALDGLSTRSKNSRGGIEFFPQRSAADMAQAPVEILRQLAERLDQPGEALLRHQPPDRE